MFPKSEVFWSIVGMFGLAMFIYGVISGDIPWWPVLKHILTAVDL